MRGAALKIGQMLSTMEDRIMPKVLLDALERARQEADIMPKSQVQRILERELGKRWQKNFKEFNLYPFAAASIGQVSFPLISKVHEAYLSCGKKVAVKIQYPGVATSIDSDINNFLRIMASNNSYNFIVFGIQPKGLYLDKVFDNLREELKWETDYLREA